MLVFGLVRLVMQERFVEKRKMWRSGSMKNFLTASHANQLPSSIMRLASLLIRYRVERLGTKFKVRFNEHASWLAKSIRL
jgi:hypothetical protein